MRYMWYDMKPVGTRVTHKANTCLNIVLRFWIEANCREAIHHKISCSTKSAAKRFPMLQESYRKEMIHNVQTRVCFMRDPCAQRLKVIRIAPHVSHANAILSAFCLKNLFLRFIVWVLQ